MPSTSIKNFLLLSIPSMLFSLLLLEFSLRYIVPASDLPHVYFDAEDHILRYDTNGKLQGLFTIGRFAQQRGKWRINNDGWNSEIDYTLYRDRERSRPLITIIGDSYIVGFQVNIEDNIASVLRKLAGNRYNIYSFGIQGAPLSQYLQISRYVKKYFDPEVLVFNLVHNDFAESIKSIVNKDYFLQINYKDEEFVELPPKPYKPRQINRILRESAIMRYLWSNLEVSASINRMLAKNKKIFYAKFDANIDIGEFLANREIIQDSTVFLIRKIREENPNKEILYLLDGPRKSIYSGEIDKSDVLWIHEIVKYACLQANSHFIDLTEAFTEKFTKDHVKFNSDYDGHWNEIGHKTAAHVLYENLNRLDIVSVAQ
jgi:hypothetical protein